MKKLETYFNLPDNVIFCNNCVISNQRPASYPEFKHTRERKNAKYMNFDKEGICDACNQAKIKNSIDWDDRERFTLFAGFVLGIAKSMGINLRWGGDWDQDWTVKDNKFDDFPHFELKK